MKRVVMAVIAVLFLSVFAFADNAPAGGGQAGASMSPDNHAKPGKVFKRQKKQLKRINRGVKSGALTKGETKKLVRDQKMIREEKKDMREDNGGKLSKEDKKTLNKEQNQESKKIYELKHNDATQ